jgi:hypothetical protein
MVYSRTLFSTRTYYRKKRGQEVLYTPLQNMPLATSLPSDRDTPLLNDLSLNNYMEMFLGGAMFVRHMLEGKCRAVTSSEFQHEVEVKCIIRHLQ